MKRKNRQKVVKMSNVEVERSIEAILMVVDEPVSETVLALYADLLAPS